LKSKKYINKILNQNIPLKQWPEDLKKVAITSSVIIGIQQFENNNII